MTTHPPNTHTFFRLKCKSYNDVMEIRKFLNIEDTPVVPITQVDAYVSKNDNAVIIYSSLEKPALFSNSNGSFIKIKNSYYNFYKDIKESYKEYQYYLTYTSHDNRKLLINLEDVVSVDTYHTIIKLSNGVRI